MIQENAAMRLWWGTGDYLDPFLVLEALRHGALPLQCVAEPDYRPLAEMLPAGLENFLLAIPPAGKIPRINRQEQEHRLDQGLSIILGGSLERDFARALAADEELCR